MLHLWIDNGTGSKCIFELERFHPHTLLVCLHAHTLLVCNLYLNLYHLNKYSFHFLFQNCFQLLRYWVPSVPSSLNQFSVYYIFHSGAYFFLFHTLLMTQCTQTLITLRTMFMLLDKHTYNLIKTKTSVTFFSGYILCICVHFCVYKMVVSYYLITLYIYCYMCIKVHIYIAFL